MSSVNQLDHIVLHLFLLDLLAFSGLLKSFHQCPVGSQQFTDKLNELAIHILQRNTKKYVNRI